MADGRPVFHGSVELTCRDDGAHRWEGRFRQVVAADGFWAAGGETVSVFIDDRGPVSARVVQVLLSRPRAAVRLLGVDACPIHTGPDVLTFAS